jgi:hypothetical protein
VKFLIIEDDQNKLANIKQFLEESYKDVVIESAISFHGGSKLSLSSSFDLIILDMSIPTYDIGGGQADGPPLAYGGKMILRQMQRNNIKTKVVVITQFETFGEGTNRITSKELDAKLNEMFNSNYTGLIYYDSSMDIWKTRLKTIINSIGE